jgi:hypothetical protein
VPCWEDALATIGGLEHILPSGSPSLCLFVCCSAVVVRLALEPDEAIADHFERMMKGLGTDEKGLSAATICYHWMQPRVEELYEKLYGRSLEERIRTDTDANYGDLLVTLLHIPTDTDGGRSGSDDGSSSCSDGKQPEDAASS